MTYDDYKTRVPDTDTCTEEPMTCECRACREWRSDRDEQEPPERTFDDQLGAVCDRREAERAAVRLKR